MQLGRGHISWFAYYIPGFHVMRVWTFSGPIIGMMDCSFRMRPKFPQALREPLLVYCCSISVAPVPRAFRLCSGELSQGQSTLCTACACCLYLRWLPQGKFGEKEIGIQAADC